MAATMAGKRIVVYFMMNCQEVEYDPDQAVKLNRMNVKNKESE